jgi:hypothetical protein
MQMRAYCVLDAVVSMCDACKPAMMVHDVDALPLVFMLRENCISSLLVCVCKVSLDVSASWATVYRDVADASMGEVSGPGTVGFVWHDILRNTVSLVPRLSSGAVAEYVTLEDIMVIADGGSAVVSVGVAGSFDCMYTVDECVRDVDIHLSVCGVLVWTGVVHPSEITGHCLPVLSSTVPLGLKLGLAVSPDSRYAAVSFATEGTLSVFRLDACGDATLLHSFGTYESGPKQYSYPGRLCLTPSGNLLVCDVGNHRVEELTGLGEAEPQHVRFIPVAKARSVAVFGDVMAVGTADGAVCLLGRATGFPIRSFSVSAPSGRTYCSCRSLCFTPDGQFIVASEEDYPQLCMFRVSNGLFVRHIGVGVLGDGEKYIEFASNGDWSCKLLAAVTIVCACSALTMTYFCEVGARRRDVTQR